MHCVKVQLLLGEEMRAVIGIQLERFLRSGNVSLLDLSRGYRAFFPCDNSLNCTLRFSPFITF